MCQLEWGAGEHWTLCNFLLATILLCFLLWKKEEERTDMEKRQLTDLQSLRRARHSHPLLEHGQKISAARPYSSFPCLWLCRSHRAPLIYLYWWIGPTGLIQIIFPHSSSVSKLVKKTEKQAQLRFFRTLISNTQQLATGETQKQWKECVFLVSFSA